MFNNKQLQGCTKCGGGGGWGGGGGGGGGGGETRTRPNFIVKGRDENITLPPQLLNSNCPQLY